MQHSQVVANARPSCDRRIIKSGCYKYHPTTTATNFNHNVQYFTPLQVQSQNLQFLPRTPPSAFPTTPSLVLSPLSPVSSTNIMFVSLWQYRGREYLPEY